MASAAMSYAEDIRSLVVASTKESTRANYSQYLTPYQTAALASSMLSDAPVGHRMRCLDLGAGTGILSVALADRYSGNVHIDAVELDEGLASVCDKELTRLEIEHTVIAEDVLQMHLEPIYDRVILNPPYKKLSAGDPRQDALPIPSPNLYSAFMMVAAESLVPGGECVAIVPRSWMNGAYFQRFREWLLNKVSLDSVHVYGSRTEIFSDTNVLQEIIIVVFSRQHQRPFVTISESYEKSSSCRSFRYPFSALVDASEGYTISVEPVQNSALSGLPTLRQVGLCASTGKVVDFRSREVLALDYREGFNKLIYACNFNDKGFEHPVFSGKPQWIDCSLSKYSRQLIPAGNYAIVKRFSSKEEKRRVKAYPLSLSVPVALENHLNYIHAGSSRNTVPIEDDESKGIAIWLSSTAVEQWFRARSGSTQVNATDLNAMPTPPRAQLRSLGKMWRFGLMQSEVDELCSSITE